MIKPPIDSTSIPTNSSVLQRFSMPIEYEVSFTRDLFDENNPTLARALCRVEASKRHRVLFVIDDGVAGAWPTLGDKIAAYAARHRRHVDLVASPLVVRGGEVCKNDGAALASVTELLDEHRIDRHSYLIAVGGGALLDMCGYAAAITHRGVRHVRVPTTVLSQADSAVGVKNGVNAFGKKNFLGTFAPPFAVLVDEGFLSTLSDRDAISGYAEAVKVALLKDATFYEWIRARAGALAVREPSALRYVVRRCAELHMEHIAGSGDPFEQGSSRPLDYGHWAAHKLESMTRHALRHGEAVAIGMAIDLLYAAELGVGTIEMAEDVLTLLERLGFELWCDMLDVWDEAGTPIVVAGIDEFREHLGGELTIGLVTAPGRMIEVHDVDERRLARAISRLRARFEDRRAAIASRHPCDFADWRAETDAVSAE